MEIVIIVIILLVICSSISAVGGIAYYFSTLDEEDEDEDVEEDEDEDVEEKEKEEEETVEPSVSPTTMEPAPITHLKNKNSNKCLDVDGARTDNGTNVQIWDCLDVPHQKWIYDIDTKELKVSHADDMCLDVVDARMDDGANVQIWKCHGGTNQQWTTESNNEFKNVNSEKCLDVHAGAKANGTNLQQHNCNISRPAQQFHMYNYEEPAIF